MGLKILLASPLAEWASSTRRALTESGHEVSVVAKGKDAQLALSRNKYFALVLDLEIQDYSGLQVLSFARKKAPGLHIIVSMDDEGTLARGDLNRNVLSRWGIDNVFINPCPPDAIILALENKQSYQDLLKTKPDLKREGPTRDELASMDDHLFTSIKIDELLPERPVLFDIYVKLAEGKYIKLLRPGDAFSEERLDKFKKEKNLKLLYFRIEDLPKYIKMQKYLCDEALKSRSLDDKKKLKAVKSLGEKIIENIYSEGLGQSILAESKNFCLAVNEIISAHDNLSMLVRQLEDLDPSAYTRGALVCIFSNMAIKQFSWTSNLINQTMGLASMLLDIGKVKLPKSIIPLRPIEMRPKQLEIYKTHPQLSFDLLKNLDGIGDSIKQIVLQHHEYSDGSGFPAGLTKEYVLSLSLIMCMVNDYVEFMVDNGLNPPTAVKQFFAKRDSIKRYGLENVEKFIKIFIDHKSIMKGIKSSNSDQ